MAYLFPSVVGKFIVREPIRLTALGVAKYGKLKSERAKKILGGVTFVGDLAGLLVSAVPIGITIFPYIWQGNEEENIYKKIEEIIEKNESVHIPVILSNSGYKEKVYNDFYIGENCDVLIVAGCGIDNCSNQDSQHDGIHRFFIGKNSKIKYVEKHYGSGNGFGRKFFNPETVVHLAGCDTYTMASLWYSLFRSDQRPTIGKISVPFLYIMPETPLYSMVTVDFYKANVKSDFVLEKDFPGTTHTILMEKPKEVAERVKAFLEA